MLPTARRWLDFKVPHKLRVVVTYSNYSFPITPPLGDSGVKNLPASAGDPGDMGLIPELGKTPGEENGYPPLHILAWRIPWTEEPGGLTL